MSDLYVEHMIKRNTPVHLRAAQIGLIALVVVFLFLGLMNTVFLPLVIIFGGLAVVLPKRWDVEYEYLYVNGELDFDVIMGASKRKRKLSINIHDLELMAPAGSSSLRSFEQQKLKTYDFSSLDPEGHTYIMILKGEQERIKVIFDPNEEIIEGIKRLEPGKVTF